MKTSDRILIALICLVIATGIFLMGTAAGMIHVELEAIRHGYARYQINPETGKTEFIFIENK
jgi:hypothetical protein